MKHTLIILTILTFFSCDSRKVKYSGLNDLVVGVQQVVLYENSDFYLELGLGGTDGIYKIQNDTVFLNYDIKPDKWPDKILITEKYFETISINRKTNAIKIWRNNENYQTEKDTNKLNLNENFEIINLKKSNDYPSSIQDTTECVDWKLNETEIKEILNNVKPISGRDWHNFYGHWNCCMNADLIQNETVYKMSVNAGAWLTISNSDTTFYFGDLTETYEKLFLSSSWTLDDME